MDPKLQAAFEEFATNAQWLSMQFVFGGDEGYRRASAFMENNRRISEQRAAARRGA